MSGMGVSGCCEEGDPPAWGVLGLGVSRIGLVQKGGDWWRFTPTQGVSPSNELQDCCWGAKQVADMLNTQG